MADELWSASYVSPGRGDSAHDLCKSASNLRDYQSCRGGVSFDTSCVKEKDHEARPDRYRKHGHFRCERWGGERERTGLWPLRRFASLHLASLCSPKPQRGSPRRSAHCSALSQSGQSGSHGRRQPRLQSNSLELVRKTVRACGAPERNAPHSTHSSSEPAARMMI